MEHVTTLIAYFRGHPGVLVGVAAALGALWYVLNRKPKMVREADQRFGQLRDERGDQYNTLRPPR
jgi:hypothetical protein